MQEGLHISLELMCLIIGLYVFIKGMAYGGIQMAIMSSFGLFIVITQLIHIGVSIISENSDAYSTEFLVPVSWLIPSLLIPLWIRMLLNKTPKISPLIVTMLVTGITTVTIAILMMKKIYWPNSIGRPIEWIPAVFGFASLVRCWDNNGKGRSLSIVLIVFITAHIVMSFSTRLYDECFVIAHILKVVWLGLTINVLSKLSKGDIFDDAVEELSKRKM